MDHILSTSKFSSVYEAFGKTDTLKKIIKVIDLHNVTEKTTIEKILIFFQEIIEYQKRALGYTTIAEIPP